MLCFQLPQEPVVETSTFGAHDENDAPDVIVLFSHSPTQYLCPRRSGGCALLEGTKLIGVFGCGCAVYSGQLAKSNLGRHGS